MFLNFRQLESIGYTKDQGERPDVLDILSKVGMSSQDRQQLEQRLREQQKFYPLPTKHSSPETEEELRPTRPIGKFIFTKFLLRTF